ncbi:MAG: UDP binding domain-containing protein, partial [Alphaproteobacteria bacterium]
GRIIAALGGTVRDRRNAFLGLTFKPNTDDMREAPSLHIIPALQAAGAHVCAYDPEGMDEARPLLPGVQWCTDSWQALTGADALVIVTEWNEFRGLDLARARRLMRQPVLIDLRNIYSPADAAQQGFRYTSLGRPPGIPAAEAPPTDTPTTGDHPSS